MDRSVVPYNKRNDRDTPSAQEKIGKVRAYLLAGCDFNVCRGYGEKDVILKASEAIKYIESSEDTCYIRIKYYEFEGDECRNTTYIPSLKQIIHANGGDRY